MVKRLPNGNLTWEQDGTNVQVVKEDVAMYSPALITYDAQQAAQQANKAALDAYTQDVRNAQVNVDASRPINGIPEKPSHVTVSDPVLDGTSVILGEKSEGPWPEPPPLPVVKPKMIYPSGGGGPIEEPIRFT